jgi:phasin family protein
MADQKTETNGADVKAAAPATATKAAEAPAAVAKAAVAPAKAAAETARKAPAKPAGAAAKAARKPAPARKAKPAKKQTAKAAKPVRAAAKTIVKTQTEGTRKMKNEANKVADRMQAVFGDANERAKDAFERNTRFAEEMTELAKGNVEALVASTKVAAKGIEKLGNEVAEFSRKSFEDASSAVKGFAEVKSPTDFFRLQTEFARTQFDSMVSETSKMSETMIKLAGDMVEPISSRYAVAAERVKNVVAA